MFNGTVFRSQSMAALKFLVKSTGKTMNHSPIEVILYDLGNVILPFNHFQIAEKLCRFSQRKEFRDPSKVFSYLFDFENGAVNGYEAGNVSSSEFFQSLREFLQLSLSFEDFVPIWNDIFTENQEVSQTILSQKGRRKLGLLSNTNLLHFDYILSKFSIVQAFDQWILSHETVSKNLLWRSIKKQSSGPPSSPGKFFLLMI